MKLNKILKPYLPYIIAGTVLLLIIGFSTYLIQRNLMLTEIVGDLVESQQDYKLSEEVFKKNFHDKMIKARQVYQWQVWPLYPSKVGPVRLKAVHAMSLKDYDELIWIAWDGNRQLSIPMDDSDHRNYMVQSKWILESAMYNAVKHKTGEVVPFTGYMPDAVWMVYKIYKWDNTPVKGSPLYIRAMHRGDLDIFAILKEWRNAAKFDFVYYQWLLNRYDYNFDFANTGFHFSPNKPDYWYYELGLRNIPRFIDGKFEGHYMKQYNQTVVAIAHSIADGSMKRPDQMKKFLRLHKKYNEHRMAYISGLRLQIKHKDDTEKLKKDLAEVNAEFEAYVERTDQIIKKQAEVNGYVLDYKYYKRQKFKDKALEGIAAVKELYYSLKKDRGGK